MTRFLISIPFLFLLQTAAASPIADVICDTTPRMEQRLVRTMMAERQASGMRSGDQVMEVWTDTNGDWVLVSKYATGTSCIVAMGEHWQQEKPSS